MKHVRLALIGAVALALVACDSAKQESTPVPEELPVNKETPAQVAPAPAPDTTKKDTVVEEKAAVKKKPFSKKAEPSTTTNVQKKDNRDVPTTAAPTNVQKRPSRE